MESTIIKIIKINNLRNFFFILFKIYEIQFTNYVFFAIILFRIEVLLMLDNNLLTNLDIKKLSLKDLAFLLKLLTETKPQEDEIEVT